MSQQPPRDSPREPDPTDAGWVDHILDQLTNRPMPAGPDVEPAPPGDADVPEPPPEPDAGEAPPEPEPSPPSPPEAQPGLLDELLAPETEPAGEPPPVTPPPQAPPPAPPEPATPPPPPPPEPLERATPPPPPPVPPPPPAPPPEPLERATPPPPPPAIPPPPRRAPRPAPALRHADPLLAARPSPPEPAPPPGPAPRRRTRGALPEAAGELYDDDAYDGYEEDFGEHLEESHSRWRTVVGWAVTLALAIVLSLLIRSFVAHAFHVESGSMEPTLTPGDRILVNKLADNPSRGDLVVFNRPDGDLVKRVVALEGETVYFDEGLVKIGDKWLTEPYLSAGMGTYVRSAIPNCDAAEGSGGTDACVVPEGHVFVLGDNRNVSFDSRNFGPVPHEDLIGSAAFQFWPLGDLRGF